MTELLHVVLESVRFFFVTELELVLDSLGLMLEVDLEACRLLIGPDPFALFVFLDHEWPSVDRMLKVRRRNVTIKVDAQDPCAIGILRAEEAVGFRLFDNGFGALDLLKRIGQLRVDRNPKADRWAPPPGDTSDRLDGGVCCPRFRRDDPVDLDEYVTGDTVVEARDRLDVAVVSLLFVDCIAITLILRITS